MSAPPLVVVPACDESAFRAERRVNFGSALPELLERLGFGTWDSCTLAEVGEETLAGRPLVVVAYAPQVLWSRAALTALRAYRGPCLIEGPVPDNAGLELFGVVPDGQVEDFVGQVELAPPSSGVERRAETRKRRRWWMFWRRKPRKADEQAPDEPAFEAGLRRSPLAEAPVRISSLADRTRSRAGTISREELAGHRGGALAVAFLDDAVTRLSHPKRAPRQARPALSYARLLVEAARLLDESDPALTQVAPWRFKTTLALLRLVSRALETKAPLDSAEAGTVLSGRGGDTAERELDLVPLDRHVPEVLEFLLPAYRLAALRHPDEVDDYRGLVPALEKLVVPADVDDAEGTTWAALGLADSAKAVRGRRVKRLAVRRLAALCMWSELAGVHLAVAPLTEEGEEAETLELEAMRVRDMARVARYAPGSEEVVLAALQRLLGLLADRDASDPPLALGLTAEAASILGDEPSLQAVIEMAEQIRDRDSGLLSVAGTAVPYADPWFGACLFAAARRTLAAVPGVREELVERWRRGLGPLQRWITLDDGDTARVLLRVADELAETNGLPVAVQQGARIGLAFPLLSWAVAECAPPPASEGASYVVASASEAWDTALALLEAACASAGLPRRVTWPWPEALGATLVHDVRAVPPKPVLGHSLAREQSEGRACTYCFSPADPHPRLAVLVEQLGHEIALNGARAGRFDSGVDALCSWTNASIAGALGRERFHGPAEWMEAEAAGLSYTVLSWEPSGGHPLPLGSVDGERGCARLLGLDAFHRGGSASVPAALRRRDHLTLSPDGASAVAHELRERGWWAPLSVVAQRTKHVNQVRAAVRDGILELTSSVDVPALQILLGEQEGKVPCLLSGDALLGRLAPGAGPGTYGLDVEADAPARIVWRIEAEAGKVPVLEPSPPVLISRYVSPYEIQARLDEVGVGLPEEMPLEREEAELPDPGE